MSSRRDSQSQRERTRIGTYKVRRFRGINLLSTVTTIPFEYASDLLNVMLSPSGGLEKLRIPQPVTPGIANVGTGPQVVFDFQRADGTRQVILQFGGSLYWTDPDNLAAVPTLIETNDDYAARFNWKSSNQIAFGHNGRVAKKWTGTALQNHGGDRPAVVPALGAKVAGVLTLVTGRRYRHAFKSSVTFNETSASDPSALTGALTNQDQQLTLTTPTDTQFDTIVLFATRDSGADYFFHSEIPLAAGFGATIAFTDNKLDAALGNSRAQLINGRPPVGKYLARWQGRLFIFNLVGAPQDIAYTGYERILRGRPEECCPPGNRLRLATGADEISGGGVLPAGVVAFSKSNEMFMFRGAVQDITVSTPVQFTAFLEQLPWAIGCLSHYTIQSTPVGLIWLGSNKAIYRFDGAHRPQEIGPEILPLLADITPGAFDRCTSSFFNWSHTDWYCLLLPTKGSFTPNRIVMVDTNPEPKENLGATILDVEADTVEVIENSRGEQQLVIGVGGRLYDLGQHFDETIQGLNAEITVDKTAFLDAYWKSGYAGAESSEVVKMFRYGRLVTDTPGFTVALDLVDDGLGMTFRNPLHIDIPEQDIQPEGTYSVNEKARRCAVTIKFPKVDGSASALEMELHAKAVTTR